LAVLILTFFIVVLSCSFLFLNTVLSSKGVSRKIFRGGKKKHQDRKIAPICFPHFISGGLELEDALGMKHQGLTSRECCTKSPA